MNATDSGLRRNDVNGQIQTFRETLVGKAQKKLRKKDFFRSWEAIADISWISRRGVSCRLYSMQNSRDESRKTSFFLESPFDGSKQSGCLVRISTPQSLLNT